MGKDLELLLSKYFLLVLQRAILTSTLLLRFATTTTMSFAPNTAPEFHEERAALIAELYANISLGNGVMEGTSGDPGISLAGGCRVLAGPG